MARSFQTGNANLCIVPEAFDARWYFYDILLAFRHKTSEHKFVVVIKKR